MPPELKLLPNSRLQIFKQLLAKALKDEKYLTKARLEAAIKGYTK
jgi:hypothetical protein